MGDETDHQSVRRRLSEEDEKMSKGDHAPVNVMSAESSVVSQGGSVSPAPKEWVKFEEDGAGASASSTPEKESNNKSSKVKQNFQ